MSRIALLTVLVLLVLLLATAGWTLAALRAGCGALRSALGSTRRVKRSC